MATPLPRARRISVAADRAPSNRTPNISGAADRDALDAETLALLLNPSARGPCHASPAPRCPASSCAGAGDVAARASPRRSAIEKYDDGEAGGNASARGGFLWRSPEDLLSRFSDGRAGFRAGIAEAAGCTSSRVPMAAKFGAGDSLKLAVSPALAGRKFAEDGWDEAGSAARGGFLLASSTTGAPEETGCATLPVGSAPSAGKFTPQYPGWRLVNSTST